MMAREVDKRLSTVPGQTNSLANETSLFALWGNPNPMISWGFRIKAN